MNTKQPMEESLETSNQEAGNTLKCKYCNKAAKPGTAEPPNPAYVPKCPLGGADMRQVYSSDSKEEWVCANLALEAPIVMSKYDKWKELFLKTKFIHRK